MIGVLLVDDDYLVRMYLRQLIDWEKEGYWLAGDACNGEEALRILEEKPVQLLITDLGMPVVDGVTLIRQVKEKELPVRIAVLSCHDEFEYVKEAMRLGADEYVLKNDLNADSLRELLTAMGRKIAESQVQEDRRQELWKLAQKGSAQLKKEALDRLLAEELPAVEQSALLESSQWNGRYHSAGAIAIDLRDQTQTDTLEQVCRQLLRDTTCELFVLPAVALVIVDLSDLPRRSEQQARLQKLARRISKALEQYAATTPVIAASEVHQAGGNVTRALREARRLLDWGFYGGRVVLQDGIPALEPGLPAEALALAKEQPGDPVEWGERYRRLLEAVRERMVAPAAILEWIAELDQQCGLQEKPPRNLEECLAREERYEALWRERRALEEINAENPAVVQAAQHVRQHFSEPLSLNSVAEAVRLNPAYLSHIFKKEMGMGFSEYLQQQRMEYAKQALRDGGRPAKEVAQEAGFYDYRHFSKLFKKLTGLGPTEWRRGTF